MFIKYCFFLTLFYFIKHISCDPSQNITGLSIGLVRQKTPFEQIINNEKYLQKYGLNFNWVYKKHHKMNRTNDSIALYRYLDNEFYGVIVIGHPGQTLNVAFDTAWTYSWVMSSQCSWSHIGCLFHNKYDHSKSSEYKKNGTKIQIPEGQFNLSGFWSKDNISIAHSNVTNQTFIEMTEIPYTYLFSKVDGVLGLGLKYDDYDPFFYTLLKQNKIKNPIFSIYLNRDKQSKHGGNVIMGFIDWKHVHSVKDKNNNTIYDKIVYLPIKATKFWEFEIDGIYFDQKKKTPVVTCDNPHCLAIVDTSSNNILGPRDFIDKIHVEMKAKSFFLDRWTVPCDTVNKLPPIQFTLGGQNFTLKGRDYTVKMTIYSFTTCLSAFVPHNYDNFWVIGGAFLSEYYSVYDINNKQIGFVKAA